MNEQKQRIEELFQAALELGSPDERARLLDRTSAGEPALRAEVEELLRAAEAAEAVFQPYEQARATEHIEPGELIRERPGSVIGRYKLLEEIGEGGMGVVYMAEQQEPVHRRVAFKIIKLGMDTKSVIARFEAERQALALMDHPNIAKVLDGGATDTGRSYFVMELVQGVPLTRFCEENQLSTEERLKLFITVCQAIQHAHQKGIIHRDLKPTNVLVTLNDGVPHPMVIDFGVAKAIHQKLTEKTLFTHFATLIGTPAYMSPEQAEMSKQDVDTRSDIYSLGVLLYELLTGAPPFPEERLRNTSYAEMQRIICVEKPPRPSTRCTRTVDPKSHASLVTRHSPLSSDLDWIVMKCLEKDRTRRYETANGLAMDLTRHLDNQPVLARPPSRLYEFRKSVQRHKVGFAATAAIILVLLAGVLMSTWQAVRATKAQHEAVAARLQAEMERNNEAKLHKQAQTEAQKAQAEALAARERAYASDMNLAEQALDENNLGGALELLNRQRPRPGQKDLRSWEWRYLWGQTRSDALFTFCQQSRQIESLAASADGRWLAVGVKHKDGIFVYDLQTRQQVAHLAAGESRVRASFAPTEALLAFAGTVISGSRKKQSTLHLWNAATRQMVGEFPLDHECVGLAFSQDGRTLVTSTAHGHITLWRVSDETKLSDYPATDQANFTPATGFAVTPDLNLAAYNCGPFNSQRVRVIDLRDGKELWTTVAPKELITALAFSPDGKILATAAGYNESDIHLWDAATGQEIGPLKEHSSWVGSLVFWPDGQKLASSSADQTIRIWNVTSRKCLDVLRGNRSEVWRLALLPDGKTLVSGAKDGTVCFWDTSVTHLRLPRITIPENVVDWRFSPDSQSVFTLDRQGQVTRWSGPEFQQQERLLEVGTNFISQPHNNVFSQDGRFLAFGSANGVIEVWDVSRRVLWRQWTNTTSVVAPLIFLANGSKLLTWSRTGNSNQEWDLTTGRELQSWQAVPFAANIVAFPDGKRYVEFGFYGAFRFRNVASKEVAESNLDYREASVAAVSPDSTLFAVADYLGYARVWDTATWHEKATLIRSPSAVNSVAFSPNGRRLVTSGSKPDNALRMWDVDSWQSVITLAGVGSLFGLSAFSPDGNVIGALSADGNLNLWRAPSWAEIRAKEKAKAEIAHVPQTKAR